MAKSDPNAKQQSKRTLNKSTPATDNAESESAVLAAIAALSESDRMLAEKVHAIVKANAPSLTPKLWYGMPGYAKDGKVVCFLQCAEKFKTRYATFGFQQEANLDDGEIWPTAFAIKEWGDSVETKIAELVKKAVN